MQPESVAGWRRSQSWPLFYKWGYENFSCPLACSVIIHRARLLRTPAPRREAFPAEYLLHMRFICERLASLAISQDLSPMALRRSHKQVALWCATAKTRVNKETMVVSAGMWLERRGSILHMFHIQSYLLYANQTFPVVTATCSTGPFKVLQTTQIGHILCKLSYE